MSVEPILARKAAGPVSRLPEQQPLSTHASKAHKSHSKTHKAQDRPPFECIALLLQGGGALGAYQAGVYQALAEAHLHPDWVAGISVGAINSALIAGNPPKERVEKLRAFWETVSAQPFGMPLLAALEGRDEFIWTLINHYCSVLR